MTSLTDDNPQSDLRAELDALLETAYAPPPSAADPCAAIGPDLSTTSTLDLLTEVARTEDHLAASPAPEDPERWVAQGHDIADYPLLSGKRLSDATPEDLEADREAMASRLALWQRLAHLHRELAERRLAGKSVN